MAASQIHGVLDNLRRAAGAGLSDAELLERFVARREEVAFEELVRLHGPMVFGVCRRILQNDADAEDAFQATFIVLARKAGSVRPRSMVGNWLHGVARKRGVEGECHGRPTTPEGTGGGQPVPSRCG